MAEDDLHEPTQKTPAGATIPVPERADFLADLRKVAKVPLPSTADGDDSEQ